VRLALAFLAGMLVGAVGAAGYLLASNVTLVDEVQAAASLCESYCVTWD